MAKSSQELEKPPTEMDVNTHWPGKVVLRRVVLFLAYLACVGSLLAHVGSYWDGLLIPVQGVVTLVFLVGITWCLAMVYLNLYLHHVVGLSLHKALTTLNQPRQKADLREKQRRRLEKLYLLAQLWWKRLPIYIRWAILPATVYLAAIWLTYLKGVGLPDQGLIPPGVGIALRMYSAVWIAISFLSLALPAWCTHAKS